MMIRRLFVGLACAGTLAAQTFIQMSDRQFGMFTKNASFEHETRNSRLFPGEVGGGGRSRTGE